MTAAQPAPVPPPGSILEGRMPPHPVALAQLGQVAWSRAWRAANLAAGLGALAALILMLATGVPQLAFLAWMLGGGMLAVVLYRRHHLGTLTAGMGARLGAMAGLMGFVIFGLLSLVQLLAMRGSGQLRAALEQALKTSAARSGNPEAQQMVQQFLTPEGMRMLVVLGIVLMLVLFVAVSTLGGAMAATISRKRETRSL
ncbi:MAG TPA: hypothetical protein VF154_06795 [Terriglobales bacterium]